MMKHNCTKEGKFKFIEIDLTEQETDKIKCLVCGRIWEELKKEIEDEI